MKFSENWLREWVNPDIDTSQLGERLTMAGLEVDSIAPAAAKCSGVVVGEVLSAEQHPDADRLRVCAVSDGSETFQVVCGAANVAAGMKIPFAKVGARLAGDLKIRKSKIRGIESMGMICSAEELGMEESSEGILPLPDKMTPGEDAVLALGLNDQCIEIDLTPNRGDCLGIRGLATEVSALTSTAISAPLIEPVDSTIDDAVAVTLAAPQACPRYACRVIRGIDPKAETPMWMAEKLRRSGLRSIDPVVDITNYVLLELGHPMHAFDLSKIDSNIVVRMASDGEELELLDGQQVKLAADTLLIADDSKAIAVGGVMGGASTAVNEDTRDVLLEAAFFAPLAVAGRARKMGLHTDASHRYERGVDFLLQEQAMERATALMLEIVGGEPGPVVLAAADEHLPELSPINLDQQKLDTVLGISVPAETVTEILEGLGLGVSATDAGWCVIPTSARFDLRIEPDLIEEVARVDGYNQLPLRRQRASLAMRPRAQARSKLSDLKRRLVTLGYQEAITYSFVDPDLQKAVSPNAESVALTNPISADMAVMRTSLWTGLLGALAYNTKRQQSRVRLFESGLRFLPGEDGLVQRPTLSGAVCGSRMPEQWGGPTEKYDFYDLKGDLEILLGLDEPGSDFSFDMGSHPALHDGQTASVIRDGVEVGVFGTIHPLLQQKLDLAHPVYLFELDYDQIAPKNLPNFKVLSRFPEVRRDLALVVDADLAVKTVIDTVKEVAGEPLQEVKLFDIYRGEHVDSAKKSIALGLTLQVSDRTLTEDEVNALVSSTLTELEKRHGATLRN